MSSIYPHSSKVNSSWCLLAKSAIPNKFCKRDQTLIPRNGLVWRINQLTPWVVLKHWNQLFQIFCRHFLFSLYSSLVWHRAKGRYNWQGSNPTVHKQIVHNVSLFTITIHQSPLPKRGQISSLPILRAYHLTKMVKTHH